MTPRPVARRPRRPVRPRRYLAVDGGSGAHLFAALAGRDPLLIAAGSPRHADLLVVAEPVTRKLAPAIAELARALPRPARALVIGPPAPDVLPGSDLVRVEKLLPDVLRLADASVERLAAVLTDAAWPELGPAGQSALDAGTVALPPRSEREIATELAVLSLGPVQPWTAGPLRLALVCDGEQVLSAEVEAGYAQRGIAATMQRLAWRDAAGVARQLDPLAPVASELAYRRALETLQGRQVAALVAQRREAVLALERARNHLWWLVRFASLIGANRLVAHARGLADEVARLPSAVEHGLALGWAAAAGAETAPPGPDHFSASEQLRCIADAATQLHDRVARDRMLQLRTRGIGVLAVERLRGAGVSGPVLHASEQGAGDVQSRLLTRLAAAAGDLHTAMQTSESPVGPMESPAAWTAPAGEAYATLEGPRGTIGLHLVSDGGDGPARVTWQRPSAVLLPILPEILANQKLADAEVIVASLDLAMAEADG